MTETSPGMTATPEPEPDDQGPAPRDPFEVVPQVLELVRLTGAIFFSSQWRAPWHYTSPSVADLRGVIPDGPGSLLMFHIVAEGRCWVQVRGGVPVEMVAGDVVVMPYGDAHAMGSLEPAEPIPIAHLLPPVPWREFPRIDYGGAGEHTRVVCGYLRGDAALFDPVLRALPPMFVVHPPAGPASAWVQATVQYALQAQQPFGVDASRVQRQLPELLVAEVLRLYLEDPDRAELTGWLAALRDPVAGPALALLHGDPARAWTVADLAAAVLVSRTVLVERFHEMVGRPPIRYLTEWRLNLASGLLRTTDLTVAEIAGRVGYDSEAAFSRAFKRWLGSAPAHWRAEGRTAG